MQFLNIALFAASAVALAVPQNGDHEVCPSGQFASCCQTGLLGGVVGLTCSPAPFGASNSPSSFNQGCSAEGKASYCCESLAVAGQGLFCNPAATS